MDGLLAKSTTLGWGPAMRRKHLKRLSPEHYRGQAVVHWTLTMRNRRTGWLKTAFYYWFRELLTHTCFRYGVVVPIFCLMPDHFHLVWMGLLDGSDQRRAMRHFRKAVDESLRRIGFELQDQAFDSVFKEEERTDASLRNACEYIARNPERAGLVPVDGYRQYPFTGCLVPGYPELRPFDDGYWDSLDRTVSFLRRDGLSRAT